MNMKPYALESTPKIDFSPSIPTRYRLKKPWIGIALFAILTGVLLSAPTTAKRSDDLVESMGINIKLNRSVYKNTWATVKSRLGELRIRHYRDGLQFVDDATYASRYQSLSDDFGMKMLGLWGPWENISPPRSTGRRRTGARFRLTSQNAATTR